jgi:hypothetical protein
MNQVSGETGVGMEEWDVGGEGGLNRVVGCEWRRTGLVGWKKAAGWI